jgi:sugar phosphate isomerase/epimerase
MWTSFLVEKMPREAVKTFAEHGWRCLELGEEHAHDLLKEGKPLEVGSAFAKFAADLGVAIPQGHFFMANRGCRPDDLPDRRVLDTAPQDEKEFRAAIDLMKRWIDLFNAIGISAGVYHVGGYWGNKTARSQKRIFERRVQSLQILAEYAKGGPTRICLENLTSQTGGHTAAELLKIIEAVASDGLAICLDTGHANISGVDPAAFIREAGSRLQALHIADNLGTNDDHMLPYGRGTVKWTQVMQALREVNYNGPFNFEVPGENRCPEPVRLRKLDYALELAKWMIESDR